MTDMSETPPHSAERSELPAGARFDPVTGAGLGAGGGARKQSFALQPGEPVASFNLVSSLMPLASGSAPQTYRWALGLGILIPVVAGALGFLAFAFVAAALVVPAVYVVYMYDVNQWEDQPIGVVLGAIGAAAALGTLREPRAVAPLVKLLGDEQVRWHAAQSLGEIGGKDAEEALLAALQRKDYPIMAGAHEFYMQRGGPGMEASLLDLLEQSGDLAVAQTFILKGSPALAKAARTWASEHGYKLVKKDDGYFWEQPEAPQ
jgi:hypothetical protein